jgi:CheY-like chemotaxis protein
MQMQKSILIIDNEPEIVRLVEEILSEQYDIVSALSGIEALDILQSNSNFDLILLDLMMPEMDGWKVYDQLKDDTILAQIPVAVFSARFKPDYINWAISEKQVDDYIVKPFEMQDFIERVQRLVKDKTTS